MHLVAGCNDEGFLHALARAFAALGKDDRRPSKGALSQARANIHFSYFRDAFHNLLGELDAKRTGQFQGLYLYAVDGQQLTLPRSKDIVAQGFNGRSTSRHKESYMPKGYLTHAYDVLNGITKGFTFHPTLHEQADARILLEQFETNSLTLYDRLYFSQRMCEAHFKHGSFFLLRCRSNCHVTVKKLLSCKKKIMTGMVGEKRIHFVKIWNARSKNYDVFATNLPERLVTRSTILRLYRMRWEVETSFKELTSTTKGEQWHTKSYNGLMQELYAKFWLINASKGILKITGEMPLDPMKRSYKKSNFKLILTLFVERFSWLWHKFRELIDWLKTLAKKSTEKRKRCSRRYPREIKRPASPYPYNNTEWWFDKRYDLN